MKVLMLNGSPRANGNTARALREMEKPFLEEGIEVEIIHIGHLPIRGCTACGGCRKLGKCVFDDQVNEVAPKFREADGLVLGSPVYYASANATLMAFVQRLFDHKQIEAIPAGDGFNIIQSVCVVGIDHQTDAGKSVAYGFDEAGVGGGADFDFYACIACGEHFLNSFDSFSGMIFDADAGA